MSDDQPTTVGLNPLEHRIIDLLADVATAFGVVIGHGPSRDGDVAEMVHHVHALQRMAMAQAAGRAHPDLYRLLGETLGTNHITERPAAKTVLGAMARRQRGES